MEEIAFIKTYFEGIVDDGRVDGTPHAFFVWTFFSYSRLRFCLFKFMGGGGGGFWFVISFAFQETTRQICNVEDLAISTSVALKMTFLLYIVVMWTHVWCRGGTNSDVKLCIMGAFLGGFI